MEKGTRCKRCEKTHRCRRCRKLYTNIEDFKKHMIDHALSNCKCPHCTKQFTSSNAQKAGDIYIEHIPACQKVPQCLASYVKGTLQNIAEHNSCSDEANDSSDKSHGNVDCSANESSRGTEICEPLSTCSLQNHEKSKKKTSTIICNKDGNDVYFRNNSLDSDEKLANDCVVVLTQSDVCAPAKISATTSNHITKKSRTEVNGFAKSRVRNRQNILNIKKCICGSVFSSQNHYELHVAEKHNSLHCSKCNTTFRNALSHALHSCIETSVSATTTVIQKDRALSSVGSLTTASSPLDESVSRLPAGTRFSSFDEDYDIKPTVHSDSYHIPQKKSRETNNRTVISDTKMEIAGPSSSRSANTSSSNSNDYICTTTHSAQNNNCNRLPEFLEQSTSLHSAQNNNCNRLPEFLEQSTSLHTHKSRVPVTDESWKYPSVQASHFTHQMASHEHLARKVQQCSQTQHHQQKESAQCTQCPQLNMAQTGKAPCSCYQFRTNKEAGFNSSLLNTGFPKTGSEALSHVKSVTGHQMLKCGCYGPLCLTHVLDVRNSGIKICDHNTSSRNLLSLEKQYGSSPGSEKFHEVSTMDSYLDSQNKICHIANVASIKNARVPEISVGKKCVNVVFPEVRSQCQASAVVGTTAGDSRSIKHYNCEVCPLSFYTAESVIVHLETDHHINIGNELKVYAL